MKKYLLLSLMAATFLFSMSACKKEDDDTDDPSGDIEITIVDPTPDEVVDVSATSDFVDLDLRINGAAVNKEVKDYTLKVYPVSDPTDLLVNERDTANVELQFVGYSFSVAGYASGTEFQLEVTACDELGCNDPVRATRNFSITR